MKRIPSIMQRIERIERQAFDPDANTHARFNTARKLRALRDVHTWITSGYQTVPPEPPENPSERTPSRVWAMLEAGDDLLADIVCGPLIEADRTPASLSYDELRVRWTRIANHYIDELSDPMFGDFESASQAAARTAEASRPEGMSPAWAELAAQVDALKEATPPHLGPASERPDPTLT